MAGDETVWSGLIDALPGHLGERVRVLRDGVRDGAGDADSECVVFWMHHAVRGHENPALDVARLVASELRLPLIVYQGLGGRHRFNSDRHHAFIMEGARDAAAELAGLGVRHVFHLPRDPAAPGPLASLCARAALVVCEDFPAPPFPAWTRALAQKCGRPVWMVDAACVVPMRMVGGEYLRAFKFRNKTGKLFKQRAGREWPAVEAAGVDASGFDVGFEAMDLAAADIAGLIAGCEIDHTVAPVAHTRGGSVAGYERWEAFKAKGLRGYHKRRNRAEIERGELAVSRMSAYLHHGHVSPLRLVREAWGLLKSGSGDGADKFIDELWVWRELAHHLCYLHHEMLERPEIIPDWARSTLHAHRDDPRPLKGWETLVRGRSGHRLWDAAQRSLLAHGELHNNVRMTWGKAIVGWTSGPARAQELLIDLNHRYALDGNNPNSYGGLLWCLGLLDRAFEGVDEPVTGSLRPRPLAEHAGRMDLGRYVRAMREPSWGDGVRVAVVGGGVAGMAAARALADQNAEVVVFDKGRGPGGRMSTRRMEVGGVEHRFDHGAQYFTARDERFGRVVRSWVEDGVCARWEGVIGSVEVSGEIAAKAGNPDRFVGVPGMNAVVRHLTETLGEGGEVRFGVRVGSIAREGRGWAIAGEDGAPLGAFDAVIVALPAAQAAGLLDAAPGLRAAAEGVAIAPCWSAMASFDGPVGCAFDGVFVNVEGSPLSWVARDSSKPGRGHVDGRGDGGGERWVLHAGPAWTEANLEREKEDVAQELLAAFFEAVGAEPAEPLLLAGHRWRYALTEHAVDGGCLFDREGLLAVCGDWCHGGRVEGAWLSGCAAAGRVLGEVVSRSRGG
ncbi:MAG: FAD-dependent oxidoreductase [Planctomycetota bacterium]